MTMYGIFEGHFAFGHIMQLSCTTYNTYHANVIVLFMVNSQGPIEGFHLAMQDGSRDQDKFELLI